jgi:hypothetical protein
MRASAGAGRRVEFSRPEIVYCVSGGAVTFEATVA